MVEETLSSQRGTKMKKLGLLVGLVVFSGCAAKNPQLTPELLATAINEDRDNIKILVNAVNVIEGRVKVLESHDPKIPKATPTPKPTP